MTACPLTAATSIVKFADDTVFLGLISNNDETVYLDEVERLTSWCQDNGLFLNVSKTKELIVDFRKRQQQPYTPLMISGMEFWFLATGAFGLLSWGHLISGNIVGLIAQTLFQEK